MSKLTNNLRGRIVNLLNKQGYFYIDKSNTDQADDVRNLRYGHLWNILRFNFINEWWNQMVTGRHNVYVAEPNPLLRLSDDEQTKLDSKLSPLSQSGFMQYPDLLKANCNRLPLSIVQTSFVQSTSTSEEMAMERNTKQSVLMSQNFVPPVLAEKTFLESQKSRLKWWKQFSCNVSKFTTSDDVGKVDLLYQSPWGPIKVETLSTYDSGPSEIMERSSELSYQVKYEHRYVLPHVIESELFVERGLLALLVDAYREESQDVIDNVTSPDEAKNLVLSLHHRLAPYKVSIALSKFSASLKDLRTVADHIVKDLRKAGLSVLDLPANFSLENKFMSNDEQGIPYTIVLRESTLNDGLIHIRHRDTTLTEKVHITQLRQNLVEKIRSL